MSADNGVYILKSPTSSGNFEFRVAHAQAIENLWYDYEKHKMTKEIQDQPLKDYFDRCNIRDSIESALDIAHKIYDEITKCGAPVEYGIQIIEIDRPFPSKTLKPKIKT